MYRIILAAAGGVGCHIKHFAFRRVCHTLRHRSISRNHRIRSVHHIASGINMVMAHQHYVDSQLRKYRSELRPPLDNIIVRLVAGRAVDRMMESYHRPVRIGTIFFQNFFHKLPVLRRTHIVGVERHKEHIVIRIPVVSSEFSGLLCHSQTADIRHLEMLAVGTASRVMISHVYRCWQGQQLLRA